MLQSTFSVLDLGHGPTLHGEGGGVGGKPFTWAPEQSQTIGNIIWPHQFETSISKAQTKACIVLEDSYPDSQLTLFGFPVKRPPATPCSAPLGAICSSFLNLEKIIEWDSDVQCGSNEALSIIMSEEKFLSTFTSQPDHYVRRSKNLKKHDIEKLVEWGTLEDSGLDACSTTMNAFKVFKSDDTARLILDCTPMNKVQSSPPSMGISHIHALLRDISSKKYIATVDCKSFFYQFRMSPSVARQQQAWQRSTVYLHSASNGVEIRADDCTKDGKYSVQNCVKTLQKPRRHSRVDRQYCDGS